MPANTYQDYLTMPQMLSIEMMQSIHIEMVKEIGTDADALELYGMLMDTAIRYVEIRARWPLWSREERAKNDRSRTTCHDSLILYFDVLARYLRSQGKTAAWREKLGDPEKDRLFRKAIGDMGCYIAFINGICAR